MKHTVKTENGSIYELDDQKLKWCRIVPGEITGDYPLRTASGELSFFPKIEIGKPLILIGPPIAGGMTGRMVHTSPVKELIK